MSKVNPTVQAATFTPKHIDHVLVAKTHTPMYLLHRYWARKPHNVVSEYIKAYTNSGEIVLDPFAGSGVTAIEAVRLDRKGISVDLNPLSAFLTRITSEHINLKSVEESFHNIEQEVKDRIVDLYLVICPYCKSKKAFLHGLALSYVIECPSCHKNITMAQAKRPPTKRQNIYLCPFCGEDFNYGGQAIKDEIGVVARFTCPKCGEKEHKGNGDDAVLQSPHMEVPGWVPHQRLEYPSGKPFLTARRVKSIEDLFTPRNLAALSLLYGSICAVQNDQARDLLLLTFSSAVPQASRMMIWTESSGPSWKVPEYLVYPLHWELNVWERFENRYLATLRAKKDSNSAIKHVSLAKNFSDLLKSRNLLIKTGSALGMEFIPNASVDYVFTDPPYGGSIQYYELDTLRSAWLAGPGSSQNFPRDWWKEEITISSGQEKDFSYYHSMLGAAFKEVYRVLKSGRWLTVTFHSTDIQVYNSIVQAVVFSGFELEKILYQPPAVASAKAQLQPYGSAVGDYYIRFKKPERSRKVKEAPEVDRSQFERVVLGSAKRIIAERGEPTSYQDLLKGIYTELDKHGFLLVATPARIDTVLKQHEGKDLRFIPGSGWWFEDPSKYLLHLIPLQDRVERTIIQVLRKKVVASFEDVIQEVFLKFPNALTPSPTGVRMILEEYADKTKDGKWRLKPLVIKREDEHLLVIKQLITVGRRIGYKVWAAHRDAELNKVCPKTLNLPIAQKQLRRVKEIDVLWINGDRVVSLFEVEHTTGISEAVIRAANLDYDVERIIVIPDERRRFLQRRLEEPLLKENFDKFGWKVIYYDELTAFLNEKGNRKITRNEFMEIVGRGKKLGGRGQYEFF